MDRVVVVLCRSDTQVKMLPNWVYVPLRPINPVFKGEEHFLEGMLARLDEGVRLRDGRNGAADLCLGQVFISRFDNL